MKNLNSLGQMLFILILASMAYASEPNYRLAGIIASATTEWVAVIELPDGEQVLANEGDTLGDARVLSISSRGVLLEFTMGTKLLRLDSAGFDQVQSKVVKEGVLANDFKELLENTPGLDATKQLPGLVDMQQIPTDARIVSINGQPVVQLKDGMNAIQKALDKGEQIRLTLGEGATLPIIYLAPGEMVE